MTDTLAARLRAALVGDYTGDVMPFDELKPEIQARWQRVADVARTRAEVPAPIRVPFSDAQIERMAKAYYEARWDTGKWARLSPNDQASTKSAIRAALAAGGLEPCAVPEYAPDDVALAPTGHVLRDRLVEAEAKIERQRKNLRQLYEARARDAQLIAELRAEVDEDNAAAASVNDLLVQVQNLTAERDRLRVGWENSHKAEEELETALAQLGAQEIELADLRFYQREFAAVSAELAALRERASVPVKVRHTQTARMMEFRWLEICRKYGPENDVDGCPWLEDALCDFANYLAAHAVIDAPAGVPSDPPAGQVEALARVLEEATAEGFEEEHRTYMRRLARAAIAHLSTRPEGLPTADDLWRLICSIEEMQYDWKGIEYIELEQGDMSNLLTALRPWIRDPVGCEMDVTAEEVFDEGCRAYMQSSGITTKPEMDRDDRAEVQAVIDLCRSRIRPVFECKECAELRKTVESLQGLAEQASELKRELDKEQERGMALYRQYESVEAMFHNQRKINTELKDYMARLDGSPLAVRAALEGE